MNAHHMAHEILDRVRAGGYASDRLVSRALRVTGDIPEPCREEAAHCLQRQADLYAATDDVAEWAQTHPVVVGGAA